MTVFMDTGGGDIYAGATKEACIEAMRKDVGRDFDESEIFEVGGDMLMNHEERGRITLQACHEANGVHGDTSAGYCIASENC